MEGINEREMDGTDPTIQNTERGVYDMYLSSTYDSQCPLPLWRYQLVFSHRMVGCGRGIQSYSADFYGWVRYFLLQ